MLCSHLQKSITEVFVLFGTDFGLEKVLKDTV
jgi:hypothetical protein